MDHITIRITDDAYHGELSRSRVVQFDVDLSTPANEPRPLPVHSATLTSSAGPIATLDETSEDPTELTRLRARCDGLEAALIRRQTRPRFERLSSTFEMLGESDTRAWVYIRDNVHQLIWARTCVGGPRADGRLDHDQATAACASLGNDWRLPTRAELLTLVDDTRSKPATFEPFVEDTKSDWYWTSTAAAWSSSAAWFVHFHLGYASYYLRDLPCFVRAVRSVSAPPAGQ